MFVSYRVKSAEDVLTVLSSNAKACISGKHCSAIDSLC